MQELKHFPFSYFGKNNLLFAIILLCFCSSCSTGWNLSSNQKLLRKNTISVKGIKSNNNELLKLKTELSLLYKQKPNRKWLILIRRENIYSYLQKRKKKNVLFRNTLEKISEPPSIMDENLSIATKNNINNYLFNKGYFNVKVDYKVKTSSHFASVNYIVFPNKQFLIDTLIYEVEDSNILKILLQHSNEAYINKGKPIDNLLFQNEKSRITQLLNNSGYAEFSPFFIENLDTDTSHQKTKVYLHINNPNSETPHKKYQIKEINIFTDYTPNVQRNFKQVNLDSLNFFNTPSKFYIQNSLIAKKILFRPGMIYSKERIDSCYKQLNKLEYYKFINIESKADSFNNNKLIQNIYLTPYNKWVFDIGADLNYTSLRANAVTSLFGISGYTLLKNRNIFHRAHVLDSKIEAGAELSFLSSSLFNAANINYSNSYHLPLFYDITGSYHIGRKILRPFKINLIKPDVRTTFKLGVEMVSLINLFRYFSLNTGVSYIIPISKYSRFVVNTLDLSLYIPTTYPNFNTILDSNIFLKKSFTSNRLFTSFFLSRIQYFNQVNLSAKLGRTFIFNFETSGLEVATIDGISKLVSNKNLINLKSLELSKYIKFEADHRWDYSLKDKNSLVFRINYGLAIPIGDAREIPYIKQFFMGGPQSLRAWRLRELGPGGQNLSASVIKNGNYYSSGDIKFESNIEYRFKIYWRFEGALFTDIGNVWLWPNKNNRNSLGQISKESFKQIAAGSGMGLRVDFTYFLIRLDYGMKWRNPYKDDQGNYGIYTKNRITYTLIKENSNINLALNYPF